MLPGRTGGRTCVGWAALPLCRPPCSIRHHSPAVVLCPTSTPWLLSLGTCRGNSSSIRLFHAVRASALPTLPDHACLTPTVALCRSACTCRDSTFWHVSVTCTALPAETRGGPSLPAVSGTTWRRRAFLFISFAQDSRGRGACWTCPGLYRRRTFVAARTRAGGFSSLAAFFSAVFPLAPRLRGECLCCWLSPLLFACHAVPFVLRRRLQRTLAAEAPRICLYVRRRRAVHAANLHCLSIALYAAAFILCPSPAILWRVSARHGSRLLYAACYLTFSSAFFLASGHSCALPTSCAHVTGAKAGLLAGKAAATRRDRSFLY